MERALPNHAALLWTNALFMLIGFVVLALFVSSTHARGPGGVAERAAAAAASAAVTETEDAPVLPTPEM
jgi:hypothetical protein